MARKKKEEKEEIEEIEDFNIQECYKKINPLLIEGLKRYIFENDIKITNEKEFKKLYEKYGGF